jgi:hypothetical protein
LTAILGIIFVFISYLFFMPIKFRIKIRLDKKVSAVSEVRIFPFEHKFIRDKLEKVEKPPKAGKKLGVRKPKKKLNLSRLGVNDIAILKKVISESLKFAGRVIEAPHYSLKADIAGGACEPDLTGEIYGAYQAIRFALPESISISYRPNFAAEKFSGTVELGLAIRAIKLLTETLILIFRLPIIKLIKLYRKLRKGG